MGFQWRLERLADVTNSANLLFLGLGASALCFVVWTFAIKRLGAVKSCAYIYLVPVVTVVTAVLVLHERITLMAAAGIALTMCSRRTQGKKAPVRGLQRQEQHFAFAAVQDRINR